MFARDEKGHASQHADAFLYSEFKSWTYGVGAVGGDSVVVVVVPVVASGLIAAVASGDVVAAVVSGDVVAAGLPAGVTVSVFCSHAASRAALARMQMYFFIVVVVRRILGLLWIRSKPAA